MSTSVFGAAAQQPSTAASVQASKASRRNFCAAGAASLFAALAGPAVAQAAYPAKPVKIIVTYTPGGANDVSARVYGQLLGDRLKQAFIVENRPGASGITGTTATARAEADGYTLLLGAGGTMTINPGLFPHLTYDPLKDFAPVGLAARSPLVVVVPASSPARNVSELIALARKQKGGISYASPGAGTPLHLAAELFSRQADIETLHVPYKGSSPALTDLMAGRVDVMFDVLGTSLPYIQSGRLRALAVTTALRSRYLPDVPTLDEQGLKGFDVSSWFGFFVPAKTPADVVATLNRTLRDAAATPEARDRLAPLGMEPVSSTAQELRTLVETEQAKWKELIRVANIQPN